MDERAHYYRKLKKPSWAPPAWLFGPVWTVLYILIAFSFSKIFYLAYTEEIPRFIAFFFIVNSVTNLLFSFFQFVLRSNVLALVDIFIVLGSLLGGMFFAYTFVPFEVKILVPYALWVLFATILQTSVTILNRKK